VNVKKIDIVLDLPDQALHKEPVQVHMQGIDRIEPRTPNGDTIHHLVEGLT
jgi:hypothetical protein